MSYLAESEIARVEWRVRQIHEKIREAGQSFSGRNSQSQIEAALSQQRRYLESVRSTPAGQSTATPTLDFSREINQLQEEASGPSAKRSWRSRSRSNYGMN